MSTPDFLPSWPGAHGLRSAESLLHASTGGSGPHHHGSAPGRVNLIGEHTDYNDGLCLPIALPHRTFAAASRRQDTTISLQSGLEDGPWQADLNDVAPGSVSGWGSYVAGVAWALAQEGIAVPGFDLAVASCVPYGAGLSSSAALECASLMALASMLGADWTGPDLDTDAGRAWAVQVCVRAENEIAGAPTGGMDQAASLRCSAGHALALDIQSGQARQVPFDLSGADLELLVIDTRAEHALVDGQYAQRRDTCQQAAAQLGVASLREVSADRLAETLGQLDDETMSARVRHVITEIARVQEFIEALRHEDFARAGELMDASHASLATDYEVSCAELDTAVGAARDAGALGARMTGGGFGGSAIALIRRGRATEVAAAVAAAFDRAGHDEPAFLTAEASEPARAH